MKIALWDFPHLSECRGCSGRGYVYKKESSHYYPEQSVPEQMIRHIADHGGENFDFYETSCGWCEGTGELQGDDLMQEIEEFLDKCMPRIKSKKSKKFITKNLLSFRKSGCLTVFQVAEIIDKYKLND